MIAMLFSLADAWAVLTTKSGDVCVEFQLDFVDLKGDYWTDNADRPARGLYVEITDAAGTRGYDLDDQTGCLDDVEVVVEWVGGTFDLLVRSTATVNGIEVESWSGADLTVAAFAEVNHTINTGSGLTFAATKTVPMTQRWRNLAVATWLFSRYTFNLDQGNARDCCLESATGYDTDGTCPSPSTGGYARISTPIQMQAEFGGGCCGSDIDDGSTVGNDPPGVYTDLDVFYRWAIAHELGHVIAGMRTGGKEWGQYRSDAPDNDCAGDFEPDGTAISEADDRGEFTREYMSVAFREGWANFVAAVTWNALTETSCDFQVAWQFHDFDLDGDIDDDFTSGGDDGWFKCEGAPEAQQADTTDPTATYMDAKNWLSDLVAASDAQGCYDPPPLVPVGFLNAATVFDVTRMLWDLATDQAMTPGDLADVYVDSCPRGWAERDSTIQEELPWQRFQQSASFHGFSTHLAAEDDNVVP